MAPTLDLLGIDLDMLTRYAVQARYDFDFWPDRETAEQALVMSERVRQSVLAHLPPEVQP